MLKINTLICYCSRVTEAKMRDFSSSLLRFVKPNITLHCHNSPLGPQLHQYTQLRFPMLHSWLRLVVSTQGCICSLQHLVSSLSVDLLSETCKFAIVWSFISSTTLVSHLCNALHVFLFPCFQYRVNYIKLNRLVSIENSQQLKLLRGSQVFIGGILQF